MKIKQILFFVLIALMFPVSARWVLQFDHETLLDNKNNNQIIAKLKKILPSYHNSYNPTLQFTFHNKRYSDLRWQTLVNIIPALKSYSFHIYHSPDSNLLSIGFRHIATNQCPSPLIISDSALPIDKAGLKILSDATLSLSTHSVIRIEKSEDHAIALLYDNTTQAIKSLATGKHFYPVIPPKGITIGLMKKDRQTLAQLKIKLKTAIKNNAYHHKGMSLSPVPIESIHTINARKDNNACFIRISPLQIINTNQSYP